MDRGQAAISLPPAVDGTHVHIFESLQLEVSYVGTYCIYLGVVLLGLMVVLYLTF